MFQHHLWVHPHFEKMPLIAEFSSGGRSWTGPVVPVKAQFNKRLKETIRTWRSSVIF